MGKKHTHILIVSQYFYPENFRINDIALELERRGYKITVLTGIPNYPEGKFYKGYGWTKNRKSKLGEINIIRLPIISRGKNKFKLVLNYYSFAILGKLWAKFTKLKFDVVFTFETSPIIQAEISDCISKRMKIPHYLYIQDLWPDNLEVIAGIRNKTILKHYKKICKKIYDRSTTIFATSPSFVKTLKGRTKTNVMYLPQYAEDFYKPVKLTKTNQLIKSNKFKIIFTGNIGKAQGLDILIETAKKIDNVLFIIVGNGRYKEQFVRNASVVRDKFLIIDRKPAKEIPYLLNECDVALISFIDNKIFNKTIPAKLQSYMACAMPILASASGECERIIKESDCGYCSEPGNVEKLVNNINKMKSENLKAKGENALKYSLKHFYKENIINILCNELNRYNNK